MRLCNLGEWSIWVDEAHTWRDATMQLVGEHGLLREDRVFYALTFLVLRGLLNLGWIGGDEFSLRLPFVLVGILSVPVLAMCGRRLVGARAAILAAAFCAVCPWHVYWSQNARGYILVFLFAAIAANRALVAIETGRARDLLATFAAIGVATLFHTTGGLLAAGFFGFLFFRRPAPRGRAVARVAVLAVVVGLVLPWLVQFSFPDFARSKGDELSVLHLVQTTAYYFRPLVLLVGAAGLWLALPVLGRDRTLLLGCLLLVPFFVLVAVGAQVAKVTARYAFCVLPVLLWLAAFACTRVAAAIAQGRLEARRSVPMHRVAAALLPVLLLAEYGLHDVWYHGSQHGQRGLWREACAMSRELAGAGALRVLSTNQPTCLFYLRPRHWSSGKVTADSKVQVWSLEDWLIVPDPKKHPPHEPGGEHHLRWHRDAAQHDAARFVVLVTLPELQEKDHDGSVLATLRRDFELMALLPCWVGPKDESIYVYVPKGA
ncbi:MAG TPA: glycosyltransferase family 39 protein [Planctomycetota bacterium]|nr:glycosyltransferase family 39 protein [Planctomycetota bacterium]